MATAEHGKPTADGALAHHVETGSAMFQTRAEERITSELQQRCRMVGHDHRRMWKSVAILAQAGGMIMVSMGSDDQIGGIQGNWVWHRRARIDIEAYLGAARYRVASQAVMRHGRARGGAATMCCSSHQSSS